MLLFSSFCLTLQNYCFYFNYYYLYFIIDVLFVQNE